MCECTHTCLRQLICKFFFLAGVYKSVFSQVMQAERGANIKYSVKNLYIALKLLQFLSVIFTVPCSFVALIWF